MLELSERGPDRAEILVLLAELESVERAVLLLEEALRETAATPPLRALVLTRLALAMRFRAGFVRACEPARAALELADGLDDDALRVRALGALYWLELASGDEAAPAHAAQAHEIATRLGDAALLREASEGVATVLFAEGEIGRARALLEREYDRWRDRDEPWAAALLDSLSSVELAAGRWELAGNYADQAYELRVQYGLERPPFHLSVALAALYRGRLEVARQHAERGLGLAEQQLGLRPPALLSIVGLAAFWGGDAQEAVGWLLEAERAAILLEWGEPGLREWTDDLVEVLLALGRADEAEPVLDRWEADARRLRRARVLARVTRCRGLVAAAAGDLGAAAELLERALVEHADTPDSFGSARTLLTLGLVRRRARQKAAARTAIQDALTGFEELGAASWVDTARRELARISGRRREEGLTAAERRVATLVAEGRTNREVAAALFLGERTVASHLTRVYAKLGVRSRSELARRLR